MTEAAQENELSQGESGVNDLLAHFRTYASARISFISQLTRDRSCRDPLAEFSEVLVALLLGARHAESRVQQHYDLIRPNGRRVQVKYLANPDRTWINEHHIQFNESIEDYALVVFDAFQIQSVIVFPRESIGRVCALLGKRHPNQDMTLQFTRRNYDAILADQARFERSGLRIYQF